MLDIPKLLEIAISLLLAFFAGMIGGFVGISLAAQSEIRRRMARAKALDRNREKKNGQNIQP